MKIEEIAVEIRFSSKSGPVKAYADVEMRTTNGSLKEHGYAVIQKDEKPPLLVFPAGLETLLASSFRSSRQKEMLDRQSWTTYFVPTSLL